MRYRDLIKTFPRIAVIEAFFVRACPSLLPREVKSVLLRLFLYENRQRRSAAVQTALEQ
jgi:hypothetical protein